MAAHLISVFVDTCVMKYTKDEVTRIFKVVDEFVAPDGTRIRGPFHRIAVVNPNDKLDPSQRKEADKLPLIAHLAKKGLIQLLFHMEVEWELIGLTIIGDGAGRFWGAPIKHVEPPFNCDRIVAGPDWTGSLAGKYPKLRPTDRWAMDFFQSVDDRRFKQLQRACGAYQGKTTRLSELMDAFHVYCAEHAHADYFLTADKKLIRHVRNHKSCKPKVALVTPIELLARLRKRSVRIAVEMLRFSLNRRMRQASSHA